MIRELYGYPALRIAGLFAGVGVTELGMHWAGHQTELLCDVLLQRAGAPRALPRVSTGMTSRGCDRCHLRSIWCAPDSPAKT